jgi:hypothetical protein
MSFAARYWLAGIDPCEIFYRNGYTPDPWQEELLRLRPVAALVCWGRQTGKTLCVSALCLSQALFRAPSLVLISSHNQTKSKEMLKKVMTLYKPYEQEIPLVVDSTEEKAFANGSRIIALPGTPESPRTYTAHLAVLDEASWTANGLRDSLVFVLATTNGPLIAMSTPPEEPFGWWWSAWTQAGALDAQQAVNAKDEWFRTMVPSTKCPRVRPELLEREKSINPTAYAREVECKFPEFQKFSGNRPFSPEVVKAAFTNEFQPVFGGTE